MILGGCGILLAFIYTFSVQPIAAIVDIFSAIFASITQGILCAGASVYVDQLIKQASKNENNESKGE